MHVKDAVWGRFWQRAMLGLPSLAWVGSWYRRLQCSCEDWAHVQEQPFLVVPPNSGARPLFRAQSSLLDNWANPLSLPLQSCFCPG